MWTQRIGLGVSLVAPALMLAITGRFLLWNFVGRMQVKSLDHDFV